MTPATAMSPRPAPPVGEDPRPRDEALKQHRDAVEAANREEPQPAAGATQADGEAS